LPLHARPDKISAAFDCRLAVLRCPGSDALRANTAYLDVTNNPGPTRTACHRGWSCRHERPRVRSAPPRARGVSSHMPSLVPRLMPNARLIFLVALSLLAGLAVGPVRAQQNEARVALVIGNAAYPDADAPLKEPVNNVRALTDELKRHGFEV